MNKKVELLAPAGNFEKLKTALYFGADAVYLAYKQFGLRAFADNFDEEQLPLAVRYCHERGKKVYVTLNIFAHNADFSTMRDIVLLLAECKVDGVIVSDMGVMSVIKQFAPSLDIHLSTQANLTNKYAAKAYVDMGVKRLVTARELTLNEIREIRDFIPDDIEIESFVHGAMCISYSGRCLLSNYMTGRLSNHGECAQSCRWEYALMEKSRGEYFPIEEDNRGAYILNSKDLNMIEHIDKLIDAGVTSFKVEGRVKTAYYVASVVNAYRRALDYYYAWSKNRLDKTEQFIKSNVEIQMNNSSFEGAKNDERTPDFDLNTSEFTLPREIVNDLDKPSHRKYCTGFYFGKNPDGECYDTSKPRQEYDFAAIVTGKFEGGFIAEMRNRFKVGERLEVLSPGACHNEIIEIERMTDLENNEVTDAQLVQQQLKIYSDLDLKSGDILRKKVVK